MQRASLKRINKKKKEEAISYISIYQMLTTDKIGRISATIAVNLFKRFCSRLYYLHPACRTTPQSPRVGRK